MATAEPDTRLEDLERLNQLYAMLSRINRTIVRVDDPHELYAAACRIAVEEGGFRLAWIGLAEPASQTVVPVARAGLVLDGDVLRDSAARPEDRGALGHAIHDKRPCIVNDLARDPRIPDGPRLVETTGLRAVAAFPLRADNHVIGAFAVATDALGFFDDAEVRLLDEVAGDIAFALEVMRREEQRIAGESKVRFLAYYDSQTGLPGRALFEQRLATGCEGGHAVAVLAISLRRYHGILQALGAGAGVELARAVAGKLEVLLPAALIARLSDTEFALALAGKDQTEAADVAGRIHAVLSEGISASGQEVFVDAFIGIALCPQDGGPAEVLRRALVATGRPHRDDEPGFRFFSTELEEGSRRRLGLDAALRRAVDRQEFVLHYQPQLSLADGRIVGAEALLRWQRPDHGLVAPAEFIGLLEESGLINPVGEWALDDACRTARRWQDEGLPPLRVAVNVSARQFLGGDVKAMVRRALDTTGLDPQCLELELTESTVLQNAEASIHALRELKAAGVSHALDDFGTGYSSLSYLQRLPVDRIKIDQSFVREINRTPGSAAIARAMVGMAHSLGLTAIAEGVETEGQLGYLRSLECDEMQGYYFSRPLAADAFAELLRQGRGLPTAEAAAKGERVLLLVDDEPNILAALKRVLRRTGLRVLATASAREGFELLAAHPVGVVVCDQRMPEMAGTEFLRRVKELHPETVRMVLTGYTDLQSAIDAINRGAVFRFLTKPWEEKALVESIEEAFRFHDLTRQNRELMDRLRQLSAAPGGHA